MAFDFKNASAAERKAEYKRIAAEIGDDMFFTKKELDHLPEILLDEERVISFTSGLMDGNTWLITLTDKRIIFLDKGMLYGLKQAVIDLDKVNAVSGETGLLLGSISIQDGALNRTIKNVQKKTVVNFTNKVRDAIEARKRGHVVHVLSPQPSADFDVISQLERLAALKEKGILTQEEFEQQKAKLTLTEAPSIAAKTEVNHTPPVTVPLPTSAIQTSPVTSNATNCPTGEGRRVGMQLGVGIAIMPLIFSWFTLRNGYTTKARAIAFGWLTLTLIVAFSGESGSNKASTSQAQPATAVTQAANETAKEAQPESELVAEPAEEAAMPAPEQVANVTFDLTPSQFQKKFNALSSKLDDNLAIHNLEVGEGEVNNTFNHMFNNNAGLVGTVDKKNGEIMSFMFLFSGTQDQQELLQAVSVPLFVSQIINPEQDKGKQSKLILNMMSESIKNLDGGDTITHEIGDVQYSSSASKYTGLMLAIEPAN